ncbi:MAG: transglutaminase domain-containing protein [Candidatus Melainabacteria bacterium]|nr:transglutaminase domain-containing protein [Candidatus Melainabacteria bacterium]
MSNQNNKPQFRFEVDSVHPKTGGVLNNLPNKAAKRVSPTDAVAIFAARKTRVDAAHLPQAVARMQTQSFAAQPGFASTTQSPASIAEMARALKNDVDLIFYHVYNQIEYYPTNGVQKGSLGCLIDGIGNAWDQASLLVDLLREAGYTANFVYGVIDLSKDEAAAWLGTDSSDIVLPSYVLTHGGIPNNPYGEGEEARISLNHVWVKVEIDNVEYVLDPSYKAYTNISGIDLGVAMDYDQTSLLSAADTGTTHGTGDLWIQNVNESAIGTELTGYASNLIDWIKTNNPTATMEEIVGGRSINQIDTPVRQTSLPYETGEPDSWEVIPNEYRTTMQFEYPGIDRTFFSDEIYGKRLTFFFNTSYEPELRLDGELKNAGTAQAADSSALALVTILHPYVDTVYDQSFNLLINAPYTGNVVTFYYLIGATFGATREGMVHYHEKRMSVAKASGANEFAEELLGEQLSVAFYTLAAELARSSDLLSQMSNCKYVYHHNVGRCARISAPTFFDFAIFDVPGVSVSFSTLVEDNDEAAEKLSFAIGMHSYAIEQLALAQVLGIPASSATTVLQKANSDGPLCL